MKKIKKIENNIVKDVRQKKKIKSFFRLKIENKAIKSRIIRGIRGIIIL